MRQLITTSITLAITGALITGCASVNLAAPERNSEVKKFSPNASSSQIYVCRNSTMFGAAVRPKIEIDGQPIATIGRNTYSYTELPPGNYTIVAKTLEHDSKMPFTVAAGEQKFFQTWVSAGFLAGWGLIDTMTTAEGKRCVTEAELVEPETNPKISSK